MRSRDRAGIAAEARARIVRDLQVILDKEPEMDFQIARCVNAWHDLGTCRAIGMAVGPIPVTAVYAWCEVEGFDLESTRIVKTVIRHVDGERSAREASKANHKKMRGGR